MIRILQGDCRDVLRTLQDASVQMVCTSPPYFNLRSYLPDDHPDKGREIGLEATPAEFVAEMVAVFREVRRVLRDDGTVWLNLGDSFASAGGSGIQGTRGQRFDRRHTQEALLARRHFPEDSIKPKDLMGIPWRVAFALQDDGWYLRRDIIWSKPNPMPESCTDRPTTAHEYLFLLTKRARYFYDAEAVREPDAGQDHARGVIGPVSRSDGHLSDDSGIRTADGRNGLGRNLRSVWTIATASFAESHFATFPPKLAETCILAGTSERGACPDCGAPWARSIIKGEADEAHQAACGADASGGYNGQSTKNHDAAGVQNASDVKRRILKGMRLKTYEWRPTCSCPAASPRPCVVLDPFSGAGTTALVADRLGRDPIGIELNPTSVGMSRRRVAQDAGLFAHISEVA